MFWSDWGKNPSIKVADMDGKNVIDFLPNYSLKWPNGLTVDEETKVCGLNEQNPKIKKFNTFVY